MANELISNTPAFPGFPDFRANVTFTPIQFFTAVLPYRSRGCVRIVGYALRKLLGWVDERGNPTREQLQVTYRQFVEEAGVSRVAISEALEEALEKQCLRCVQTPQPDLRGLPAQSGIYEICWDQDGRYTDSPTEFHGFFYPEAALMPVSEENKIIHRPKAARKNIPNAFFDYLLPRERLTVIRVVGALLFYSIQWGPGGERKVSVSRSITELSRLTNFSRQHVHEAINEAQRRGYIEQVDAGCFDPAAAKESRAATYGVRWVTSPSAEKMPCATEPAETPVRKGERMVERSEKVNGTPVQKSERDRSKKVNGERLKKVNDISIKIEHKTDTTTATTAGLPTRSITPAAAVPAFDLLVKAGFDADCAHRLTQKRPWEVIKRQIDWLPYRNTNRNRLGLLRRAIEQDWPKPENGGAPEPDDHGLELGRIFARQYYAAYHGLLGELATEPFPRDARIAGGFVERLLALERNEHRVPDWGHEFGALIRQKHRSEAKAKPHLSSAISLYGNEFLRTLQQQATARQKESMDTAKVAHEAAFSPAYKQYLQQAEVEMKHTKPALYDAFLEQLRETRHNLSGGVILVSAETLALFDSEEHRLYAFAEFFRNHPQNTIFSFWQWDAQKNPQRFGYIHRISNQEAHL